MFEHAPKRALRLDEKLEADLQAIKLPSFRRVLTDIRVYLLKQNSEVDRRNNVHGILKDDRSGSAHSIWLGPQFDKGPTGSHYFLKSGSRLSFGITLKEESGHCSLIAYRFHLHLATPVGPTFYRFDLNEDQHTTPLHEPRSHLHPCDDDIRLPFPPLQPIEILDRIFQVIEH